MPRLFAGLELPTPVKHKLLSLQRDIAGARWQTSDQLHLTICFIGQADDARTNTIIAGLDQLRSAPFDLQLQGVHCFGPATRPRNLWAGVTPEEPVITLQQEVACRLDNPGQAQDTRDYQPHITLARFGKQVGPVTEFLADHAHLTSGTFTITHLSLFESHQGQTGSHYQVIERFKLGNPDGTRPELLK